MTVAERYATESIDFDLVLVMLFDFHDRAGAVPFVRVLSSLVLDADIVTHCQCRHAPGVFASVLVRLDMPFVSRQVSWGRYLPGITRMKSRIMRPNTHFAVDIFVSGSGVLRYCKTARCTASVSRSPFPPVLFVIKYFIVLTATSAWQLLWGKATEDSQIWFTPHVRRNSVDVYSGPPSDASSSGVP